MLWFGCGKGFQLIKGFHVEIQPLNVIALGETKTDNINRWIIITNSSHSYNKSLYYAVCGTCSL
jgi:hypothetical protein